MMVPAVPDTRTSPQPGLPARRQGRGTAAPRALALCLALLVLSPAPAALSGAEASSALPRAPLAFEPASRAAAVRQDGLLGIVLGTLAVASLLCAAWARREPDPVLPFAIDRPWRAPAAAPTPPDLRRLHETIPIAMAHLDRDGRLLSTNAAFATMFGGGADAHRLADCLPAALVAPVAALHAAALATGEPVLAQPLACPAGTDAAPGAEERFLLASAHPVRDAEGRVTSVSLALQDETAHRRAERMRDLLLREVNHRVKNTLATVQSLTIATLRRPDADPRATSAALVARLMALARAHDLLAARAWEPVDLDDIVRAALAPWLGEMRDRLALEGPRGIRLRPAQAQALVLALHELTTNAVRHGALSTAAGRVALRWQRDAAERVRIRWVEAGGPPVVPPPPEARGFGTRLIERALGMDLGAGAEVSLHFPPAGVEARITVLAASDPIAPRLPASAALTCLPGGRAIGAAEAPGPGRAAMAPAAAARSLPLAGTG